MKNAIATVSMIIVAFAATAAPGSAAIMTFTFGEQDFTDGEMAFFPTFQAMGAGEGFPFEDFIGSDAATGSFSLDLLLAYGAILDPIVSASIAFGILDHDSAASGSQLSSFLVDGNDLTAALDALFEAGGGAASNQYNVYSLALPVATLADGSALFSLALQGPGFGILGETTANGAGLDFISLEIVTSTPTPTPEPGTSLMVLLAAAALAARPLRRRS